MPLFFATVSGQFEGEVVRAARTHDPTGIIVNGVPANRTGLQADAGSTGSREQGSALPLLCDQSASEGLMRRKRESKTRIRARKNDRPLLVSEGDLAKILMLCAQ